MADLGSLPAACSEFTEFTEFLVDDRAQFAYIESQSHGGGPREFGSAVRLFATVFQDKTSINPLNRVSASGSSQQKTCVKVICICRGVANAV
jgi:hypothetical protein